MKISFETAKLAKEKGFNLLTNDYYYEHDNKVHSDNGDGDNEFICLDHNKYEGYYSAPLQYILTKWLREAHNIDVDVSRDEEVHYKDAIRWISKVSDWNDIKVIKYSIAHLRHPNHFHFTDFISYEEALEKGLQEALNLIK